MGYWGGKERCVVVYKAADTSIGRGSSDRMLSQVGARSGCGQGKVEVWDVYVADRQGSCRQQNHDEVQGQPAQQGTITGSTRHAEEPGDQGLPLDSLKSGTTGLASSDELACYPT
jgi:hypothetical protein